MAGSLKYFVYTDDNAQTWAIRMDESNGEAVGNDDYDAADVGILYEIPRNIKPRYATYRTPDGRYSRRVVVCDPAATAATLPGGLVVQDGSGGTAVANFSFIQGERFVRIPVDVDTGIDDGDAT